MAYTHFGESDTEVANNYC